MVFNEILKNLIDLIFPSHCIECGKRSDKPLCPECEKFLSCHSWAAALPYLEKIYAVCAYKGSVRKILKEAKFRKNILYINYLIEYYKETVKIDDKIDIIIPVPLSEKRMSERGFNQAEMIATTIARKRNICVYNKILDRWKDTPPLYGLPKRDRIHKLENAFCLISPAKVKNKNILLVDDICTTGATLMSCAKLFQESGAQSVQAFVLAKS
ncbi:MAG: hypothetical protein DKM50_04965 [Candidatus Margulisiibacteriota bacterium]|nr:MAG: hypothetical protein DKM50_04965 [Candidatus Margulisiibacteriota bacterium]